MTTYDPCRNCGKPIAVIIQRGSGFCRPDCEEEFWENEGGALRDADLEWDNQGVGTDED